MRVMIHACPAREWYVNDYLIPSLEDQGIEDITVWMDKDRRGNLMSCLNSFWHASKEPGETWHIQDDVVICRDFASRAAHAPPGIVCGFCVERYEDQKPLITGDSIGRYMWQSSFPCIKIPNDVAGDFVKWFGEEAVYREDLKGKIATGKKDDTLFHIYILEKHFNIATHNMKPHLVEHVDYLIGGSIINTMRDHVARAAFWEDEDAIKELKIKLAGK